MQKKSKMGEGLKTEILTAKAMSNAIYVGGDFFVKVKVRNDEIENIENDSAKKPYIEN